MHATSILSVGLLVSVSWEVCKNASLTFTGGIAVFSLLPPPKNLTGLIKQILKGLMAFYIPIKTSAELGFIDFQRGMEKEDGGAGTEKKTEEEVRKWESMRRLLSILLF